MREAQRGSFDMMSVAGRMWRTVAGAALLLVLSNGPVLRFVTGVLGRSAHWNDWAVWPFFAAAAVASAVLAWADRPRRGGRAGRTGREGRLARRHPAGEDPPRPATLSHTGLLALGVYSAAAVASSLWSVYPSATLWRSLVYLGLALLALTLARLSDDELAMMLVAVTTIAVGASLAVIALLTAEGVDHQGNWIGVYTNRNSLAPMAAIGVIVGLRWLLRGSATPRLHRPPIRTLVGGAVLATASLVTMAGAGSRTAWSALLLALAAASVLGLAATGMALPQRVGSRRRWLVAASGAVVTMAAGAAAAAAAWNVPTFAQRRAIWRLVWERVQDRPWGGHGFFAFWEVPELVGEHSLLQRGSAHSSLAETALGLGLLGVLPLAVLVVSATVNSGRRLWRRPSADAWMWTALSVFVLVENLAESFVLWFSYLWVLLLVAALRRGPVSAPSQRLRDSDAQASRQCGQQVAGADVL